MRRFFIALMCLIVLGMSSAAIAGGEVLGEGARGDVVKEIQERLSSLNYLDDKPDGIFGKHTSAAVHAFQKAHGLNQTGTVDDATHALLMSEDAVRAPKALARGDKGEDVKALQMRLAYFGFLEGAIDGDYGATTAAAVTALKERLIAQGHDVKKNGEADQETQRLLEGFVPYLVDVGPDAPEEEVKRVQARLIALNYMEGTADGAWGEYTADAARAFQRAEGLSDSGIIGQADMRALFDERALRAERPVPRRLTVGDSGSSVRLIEDELIVLGMLSGVPGGAYDETVVSALKRLRDHLTALEVDWVDDWADASTLEVDVQAHILSGDIPLYRADVKSGAKGDQARRIQRRLNSLYYLIHTNIDGQFGKNSVAALKAFQEVNGLDPDGVAGEATQALLFSPEAAAKPVEWKLVVSRPEQRVYVYHMDGDGQYALDRTMVCSTGLRDEMTPSGVFLKTGPQDRWHYFKKFYCWAQYTYYIDGDIMFHSVVYSSNRESSLRQSSVSMLGRRASHGCVRLAVEDAKWIYETCPAGTVVIVE